MFYEKHKFYDWNHVKYRVNKIGKFNPLILFILEYVVYITIIFAIGFCIYVMVVNNIPSELEILLIHGIIGLLIVPLTAVPLIILFITIIGSMILSIWKYNVATIIVRYIPIEITVSILSGYSIDVLNKNSYLFYERDYDIFRDLVQDLKVQAPMYKDLSNFVLMCLSDRKLSYTDSLYISLIGDYIIKQDVYEYRVD